MSGPSKKTLEGIAAEFGCYAWEESEIEELVDPKHGIISGFADVLADHEKIRAMSLPGLDIPAAVSEADKT